MLTRTLLFVKLLLLTATSMAHLSGAAGVVVSIPVATKEAGQNWQAKDKTLPGGIHFKLWCEDWEIEDWNPGANNCPATCHSLNLPVYFSFRASIDLASLSAQTGPPLYLKNCNFRI